MKNPAVLQAKVIDLHAHIVIPETIGAAGAFRPRDRAEPGRLAVFPDRQDLPAQWRAVCRQPFHGSGTSASSAWTSAGIDFQVVSPNPLTYMHFIPAEDAIRFCRIHNDALARIVGDRSSRLAGLAALPLQAPEAAAAELRRAVTELGLVGAGFGTECTPEPRRPRDGCVVRRGRAPRCASVDPPWPRGYRRARPVTRRSSASNSTSLPALRHRKPWRWRRSSTVACSTGTRDWTSASVMVAAPLRCWPVAWPRGPANGPGHHRHCVQKVPSRRVCAACGSTPISTIRRYCRCWQPSSATTTWCMAPTFSGWDAPDVQEGGAAPVAPALALNARRLLRA